MMTALATIRQSTDLVNHAVSYLIDFTVNFHSRFVKITTYTCILWQRTTHVRCGSHQRNHHSAHPLARMKHELVTVASSFRALDPTFRSLSNTGFSGSFLRSRNTSQRSG